MLLHLLDSIYPRTCIGCQQTLTSNEEFLCLNCVYHLPLCSGFGSNQSLRRHSLVGRCRVEGIHSWISYSHRGVSQRLIHHLKYFGNQPLGVWIGHQLGHHLLHYFADSIPFEGVIPVPLHPKKKKKRGFNQSATLAKGVAEVLGLPVFAEALVRTKNDKSQTSKNRFERFLNCSKRFDVGPDLPDIQSILIIDDVITTGSTLESCILPLQPIYPSISVASIAVVE